MNWDYVVVILWALKITNKHNTTTHAYLSYSLLFFTVMIELKKMKMWTAIEKQKKQKSTLITVTDNQLKVVFF